MSKLHEEMMPNVAIKEEHKMIIDEYFVNGFNGAKAMRKYRPDITDGSAKRLFSVIYHDENTKKYIAQKRSEVRASLDIKEENILVELMNWLRADATDYLGMTVDEIKKLPSEVKRCIQSITSKKKTYIDPKTKQQVTDEMLQVKIVDKLKAMEMINKHIDFYNADNQSKKSTIDISKATPEQLNAVLSLMEGQLKANGEDIIDLD
jgi:phage terminase small subunit